MEFQKKDHLFTWLSKWFLASLRIGFFGREMAPKICENLFFLFMKQTICGDLIKDQILVMNYTCLISPFYLTRSLQSEKIQRAYHVKKSSLINYYNPQVTKALSLLLGTSENIRLLSNNSVQKETNFNEWLSGLIDGDGNFLLSKKGYASLEITVDIRDSNVLYKIKSAFGGSIKLRSGAKAIRYRLFKEEGLLNLIKAVNGNIRHPNRMLQLLKICKKYNLHFLYPKPLIYNQNWLSGFFDADGAVTINKTTLRLSLSISQKTTSLLEPLIPLYGGNIYIDRASNSFKWCISKKEDIIKLLEYFKQYPCFSEKKNRLFLIPQFYQMTELKQTPEYTKRFNFFFKKWESFLFLN
jgi:hypothetical protein